MPARSPGLDERGNGAIDPLGDPEGLEVGTSHGGSGARRRCRDGARHAERPAEQLDLAPVPRVGAVARDAVDPEEALLRGRARRRAPRDADQHRDRGHDVPQSPTSPVLHDALLSASGISACARQRHPSTRARAVP